MTAMPFLPNIFHKLCSGELSSSSTGSPTAPLPLAVDAPRGMAKLDTRDTPAAPAAAAAALVRLAAVAASRIGGGVRGPAGLGKVDKFSGICVKCEINCV